LLNGTKSDKKKEKKKEPENGQTKLISPGKTKLIE